MRRYWLLPLALLACKDKTPAPSTETPVEVAADSGLAPSLRTAPPRRQPAETVWATKYVHDTLYLPATGSGVDTLVAGDTTRYVYWHYGKVVDSTRMLVSAPPDTTPNAPPVASFTTACTGLSCTFASTATDADGQVAVWLWTFPNGDTLSGAQINRTYNTAGTYNFTHTVLDNNGAKASKAGAVTVTAPPQPPDTTTAKGQGWGPHQLFGLATPPYTPFNMEMSAYTGSGAGAVLDGLTRARDQNVTLFLGPPCGSHNQDPARRGNCLRDSSGIAVFSWKRFDSTITALATPTVKAAVTKAVADGILRGWNVLDEPWVKTGNAEGNTYGPNGLSRAQADTACLHMKQRFPDVPVGLSDTWTPMWPVKNGYLFKFCDFGIPQYTTARGSMRSWRDSVVALAKRGGYQQVLSFNILNFVKDTDATYDCAAPLSGVKGTDGVWCTATPQNVVAVRDTLANQPNTCAGLGIWRYDRARYAAVSGLNAALSSGAQKQAALPAVPCKRRPI